MTLAEACALAGAALVGDRVGAVAAIGDASLSSLAGVAVYLENAASVAALSKRGAEASALGLCLTTPTLAEDLDIDAPVATMDAPKAGFARIARALHGEIASGAVADPGGFDAAIDPTARIDASASIGAGAEISAYVVIGPGVEIGPGAKIGANCSIRCATIGADGVIGPGTAIGEPGFGIFADGGRPVRMPHFGMVAIGDRVEIGANCTVDRATVGVTRIGDDTKIDHQFQVAHNVTIGRGCVFAAQSGAAGSATVGDGVVMGGQSGIGDHVVIGDGAQLGSKSGFMRNVPAGEAWGGVPAMPTHLWWRSIMFMQRGGRKKEK